MKTRFSLIIILIFFTGTMLKAQNYNTGIGLRGGFGGGITVKHFISDRDALEGILYTRWQGFVITGLYEIHQDLQVDNLNWYYGGGAHIGFWDGSYEDNPWFDDDKQYTVLGIDGVIGLEYVFPMVPISLSLDWKPAINLLGYTGFWGDGGGLSVRFVF